MKQYILPVHSFVDVITNSSSEIYVSSDSNTIKSLEKLIDNILISGGSTKKSKDLFIIDITKLVEFRSKEDKYVELYLTDDEIKKGIEAGEFGEDDVVNGYEDYTKNYLRVTPLVDSEEARAAAKTISNITNLFSIESVYNG